MYISSKTSRSYCLSALSMFRYFFQIWITWSCFPVNFLIYVMVAFGGKFDFWSGLIGAMKAIAETTIYWVAETISQSISCSLSPRLE